MEEGNVTDIKNQSNTLLYTDDLIMEIGRLHVEKMSVNRDKAILIKKVKQLELIAPAFSKKEKDINIRVENVEKSNRLYEENNKKLSNALSEEKRKNIESSKTIEFLKEEIIELKKPKPRRKRQTNNKKK